MKETFEATIKQKTETGTVRITIPKQTSNKLDLKAGTIVQITIDDNIAV